MEHNLKNLKTEWLGKRIEFYSELDSTQTKAHELANKGAEHGTIVIAEKQLKGKGRLGRVWHSANADGIWLSMVIRPPISYQHASLITLYTSLVITKALKKLYRIEAKVKWPNDVYLNNKKCAGILTEVRGDKNKIDYLIIGIGINSNKTLFPTDIREKAISLEEILNFPPDKQGLIESLFEQFEQGYQSFINFGLDSFYHEYNNLLLWKGKKIFIQNANNSINGIFLGIDNKGYLLIMDDTGQIIEVTAGDISLYN